MLVVNDWIDAVAGSQGEEQHTQVPWNDEMNKVFQVIVSDTVAGTRFIKGLSYFLKTLLFVVFSNGPTSLQCFTIIINTCR